MKTIALTLFAAMLGFAQNSTSPATSPAAVASTTPAITPAPKAAPKPVSNTQNKKPQQTAQQKAQQKTKAQPQVQAIPAGATQVEPNLYRFTDSSGKTWNYRQTPFGISKWEETAAPAPPPAGQSNPAAQVKSEPVAVTDLGDSYRFQKKTPFGGSTWVHKKSELTDEEKALVGNRQAQSDPSATTVNNKPAGNK
jgi:hypothetical protein